MASPVPTPSAAQPPPDLPSDPSISGALGVYLRNFALWCSNGFANSLRSYEALPGVMLRAYDTPLGQTPAVFMIQVATDGTIVATRVPVGGRR